MPLPISLTLALMVGAALVGLGRTVRLDVVGPTVSLIKVAETVLPQLPAASLP